MSTPSASSPPLTPSPSPSDVREFLQKQGVPVEQKKQHVQDFNAPVEISGVDESLLARAREGGVQALQPEPTIPLTPSFAPPEDPWSMRDPMNPELVVTVTPQEQDDYWRAMLHGLNMPWRVALFDGKAEIELESAPTWLQLFIDSYYDNMAQKLPQNASVARVLDQHAAAAVLIRARRLIVGTSVVVEVPDFGFRADATHDENEEALKRLQAYRVHLSPARAQAFLAACRIADMKWNICVRKQASQNFWHPAATA